MQLTYDLLNGLTVCMYVKKAFVKNGILFVQQFNGKWFKKPLCEISFYNIKRY